MTQCLRGPLRQPTIGPSSGPALFENTTLRRIHGSAVLKPEVGAVSRASAGLGAKVALSPCPCLLISMDAQPLACLNRYGGDSQLMAKPPARRHAIVGAGT